MRSCTYCTSTSTRRFPSSSHVLCLCLMFNHLLPLKLPRCRPFMTSLRPWQVGARLFGRTRLAAPPHVPPSRPRCSFLYPDAVLSCFSNGHRRFGNQTISGRCRFIPRKSFHHLQEFKLAWRLLQSSWESRWVKVSEADAHPTHPQRPISKWTAAIFPINRCATCCLSSRPAVKFTVKSCAQYLLFFVTSLHGLKNKTI